MAIDGGDRIIGEDGPSRRLRRDLRCSSGGWGARTILDALEQSEAVEAAQRIEERGYSALWYPHGMRRNVLMLGASVLARTARLIFATGIPTVYSCPPPFAAKAQRSLAEQSGNRFSLGLGVSHPEFIEGVQQLKGGPPLATMCRYIEGLDRSSTANLAAGMGMMGVCVQLKAGAYSGRQPRQGKSQEPCSLSRRKEGNQMI